MCALILLAIMFLFSVVKQNQRRYQGLIYFEWMTSKVTFWLIILSKNKLNRRLHSHTKMDLSIIIDKGSKSQNWEYPKHIIINIFEQ